MASAHGSLAQRVRALAERLVAEPSVTGTAGELKVAQLLHSYLGEHLAASDVLLELHSEGERCSGVVGFIPATTPTRRTLVLLGHFDTVGVEPYGELEALATSSEALKSHYRDSSDASIKEHAQSDDWAFGRGWLDMKGAVAAVTEVFLELSRTRDLPANLLLLLCADEEAESRGLRQLLRRVHELKRQHSLELVHVLNADYSTPADEAAPAEAFTGTVGKALIGLSVFGSPSHAAEPFAGINSAALAAHLTAGLDLNHKLLAGSGSEWLPPPTVLSSGDRRASYDVMTPDYAELYVNIFHLGREATQGWGDVKREVLRLVARWDRTRRLGLNRFVRRSNMTVAANKQRPQVLDFAGLLRLAAGKLQQPAEQLLEGLHREAQSQSSDQRAQAFHIVRELHRRAAGQTPMVVVTLLQPYYPAQLARAGSAASQRIRQLAEEHGLAVRRIYPFISDMSYFSFAGDDLAKLAAQAPIWFSAEELALYSELQAPVCNIGPWGYGAHSASERVYLPYLCEKLPQLLIAALQRLAG